MMTIAIVIVSYLLGFLSFVALLRTYLMRASISETARDVFWDKLLEKYPGLFKGTAFDLACPKCGHCEQKTERPRA